MKFSEWFEQQTPERQADTLAHLEVCVACGAAQRAGNWAEVERLNKLIRAHYVKYKD